MMTYLMAVSDELQAEERRARRAEAERYCRNEEMLALAVYVTTTDRLRACAARLLLRLAVVLDARSAQAARTATA